MVMPITFSFLAGWSKYAAERSDSAYRVSGTSTRVTPSGVSTSLSATITRAPFAAISSTCS